MDNGYRSSIMTLQTQSLQNVPSFTGAGDISNIAMSNAKEMIIVAKENMCQMHYIDFQKITSIAISFSANVTHQWANYAELYQNMFWSLGSTSRMA